TTSRAARDGRPGRSPGAPAVGDHEAGGTPGTGPSTATPARRDGGETASGNSCGTRYPAPSPSGGPMSDPTGGHGIEVVAFDGDDTLWHSESHFVDAHRRFCELLLPYVDDVA